jgi:hypothetical protein
MRAIDDEAPALVERVGAFSRSIVACESGEANEAIAI